MTQVCVASIALPVKINNPSTIVVTCQALRAQAETAWQCELHRKIHICKENCHEFLMKYVPYPLTQNFDDIPGDIFADWKPIPGKEPEGYPSLVRDSSETAYSLLICSYHSLKA